MLIETGKYAVRVPYGEAKYHLHSDAMYFAKWASKRCPGYLINVFKGGSEGPEIVGQYLYGKPTPGFEGQHRDFTRVQHKSLAPPSKPPSLED